MSFMIPMGNLRQRVLTTTSFPNNKEPDSGLFEEEKNPDAIHDPNSRWGGRPFPAIRNWFASHAL